MDNTLELLYSDFTTKVLPKVSEGMVITKDYFLDLFGRYIQYLILTDSFLVIFFIAVIVCGIFLIRKGFKKSKDRTDYGDESGWYIFGGFMIVLGLIFLFVSASDLIKDIYIPEVRMFEILANRGVI